MTVIGVFVAVHILRNILPADQGDWLVIAMAFIPARYIGEAQLFAGGELASFTSLMSHIFVHGDVPHLMFNSAWLLAFGGAIALRTGAVRFLAFAAFCGAMAALVFLLFNFGARIPMIGASGAIAGLMGGVMRFMFSAIDRGDFDALRHSPRRVPLMPLNVALRDRRVLAVTGVWILINLLAIVGFGGSSSSGGIAWEAHIGGFVAGLLCFGMFDISQLRVVESKPTLH